MMQVSASGDRLHRETMDPAVDTANRRVSRAPSWTPGTGPRTWTGDGGGLSPRTKMHAQVSFIRAELGMDRESSVEEVLARAEEAKRVTASGTV